jgi:hypothetical protein
MVRSAAHASMTYLEYVEMDIGPAILTEDSRLRASSVDLGAKMRFIASTTRSALEARLSIV